MQLTPIQQACFARDGYLIVPNAVSRITCATLRARAEALVHAFDADSQRTIFSTRSQSQHADAYFFDSADAVHFFFEEEAIDQNGQLTRPKTRAINKMGHALHVHDPLFQGFSNRDDLGNLWRQVGLGEPRLMQSMYIFKQPGIGGEVACHQDATFLYTEPQSLIGMWFALEEATRDNGCLWVMRGGHGYGLQRRFVRSHDGTRFDALPHAPWPTDAQLTPVEVAEGSLVLLHGLLPHTSQTNRSARSRHAYTLHAIDAGSAYPTDNWLQPASVALNRSLELQ